MTAASTRSGGRCLKSAKAKISAAEVLLRTIAVGGIPRGCPDADGALRPVWFGAAMPQLTAAERAELTKLAKRNERR